MVEISKNGGTTLYVLATYSNDQSGTKTFNIDGNRHQYRVRFRLTGGTNYTSGEFGLY